MPAQSKAQQRFMGMVHAAQKGDMENPSPEVEKAADSMSDKDAKDFASTKHKGLPDHVKEVLIQKLKERIRGIVREMNVTGNVDGYGTPYAFTPKGGEKKKAKRQADLTGYSVVKEGKYYVTYNKGRGQGKDLEKEFDQKTFKTTNKPKVFNSYNDAKKYAEKMEKMFRHSIGGGTAYWVSDEKMNPINENRWIDLKKEDSSPISKVNKGISNVNRQLAEIEKFLGWYGRLKNENGVTNEHFWKRTNSNIYKIKERLIKLEQQIRKISV